jgi:protein-serine/threonine kinase
VLSFFSPIPHLRHSLVLRSCQRKRDSETNGLRTDYAAPEVLSGASYRGKEQDVWALGILLYTIIYKENPFYSIDEILDHDLRVPYVMSEDSIDLVRRMLNRDVEERVTISEVLEHNWCKGVGEEVGT